MSGAAEKLGRLIAEQSSRQAGRTLDTRVGSTHNATVVVHEDGTKAVILDGADVETPVSELMNAKDGDRVSVVIRDHVATVVGNYTRPATDDEQALLAQNAAQVAWEWADEAHTAAVSAVADAADAKAAAHAAEEDAAAAEQSANDAASAATDAQGSAATAEAAATEAQRQVSDAARSASEAAQSATAAQGSAATAATAADSADASARAAASDASEASRQATRASTAASNALVQASIVEDVAGTLRWIQEHGSYVATTDTTVREGTVYFELDGSDYVPVIEPSGNPSAQGWYVLDVSDSQSDYIMAHLAVTSRGLWVLPSGMGQAQTEQQAPGYKMLLAADGSYLYDAQGSLVRSDTAAGTDFAASRDWHVGSEDAFIFFDASEGTITLGGDSIVIGGSKTLSELIAESEKAATDAEAAVKTANDVPIVTLSSTNGTTFKRNLGISTTIVATIFTPGGRVSTAQELRERFGAGAYLEWGWRDVVTDADHVLVSTDPRIIMGGFGLVVSPGDVDSQAVITCSLNY